MEKLVELFCGTGGFSRGAHDAGFEVAAAYDIDKILTSSFEINFPRTNLYHRDVSTLTSDEIRDHVGGDIYGVFGGPPCQGFSTMGKRDPSDPRRQLLAHFFRLTAELRPAFFVMENVRGLAYHDARPVLEDALDLVRDDYDFEEPRIWDASEFGAATRRNRMLVIGIRKDLGRPFRDADLELQRRPAATVREAISDLQNARELSDDRNLPGFDRWRIAKRGKPHPYAAALRTPDGSFTGHKPTAHTSKVIARFAEVAQGGKDEIGKHPRLALDGLCPTLRAGTGSELGSFQSVRPIHPTEPRVITVREAARLQGFPDSHVFHPTIWHSFRMIGNSVSPIMAKAVFTAIRDRLRPALDSNRGSEPAINEISFDIAAE